MVETVKTKRKKEKSPIRTLPTWGKAILYVFTSLLSITCILPIWLVASVSITDDSALQKFGYGFLPKIISFKAYEQILKTWDVIINAYGVTILVTVAGTLFGLLTMSMFAYAISRKSFKPRMKLSFFIFFTMLFNGGMLPSYIVIGNVLHLKNSILALILPICMSAMYILILRTFITNNVPEEVIESAKIDGAGEFATYAKIVLPMSVPGLATIGMFMAVMYWNDWYLSMLYITNDKFVPIQYVLRRIEQNIEFLAQNSAALGKERIEIPGESFKMALVMFVVLPILLAYPFFQRYFVKGMTIGAVKG